MTEESYKHACQSPTGRPVGFKASEEEKQSYLTHNDKQMIDSFVIYSVLFGLCMGSVWLTIDDLSYSIGNKIFFAGVGLIALFCMFKKSKAVSAFSEANQS